MPSSRARKGKKKTLLPFQLLPTLLLFVPFLSWMVQVRPSTLKVDFYAGLTSAIFALPQGVAFALIAGLPPEFGLYAGIVAPIVSAFFGCSWHTVMGPTVATSIVIISILSEYAVPHSPHFIGVALTLTAIAGTIQLLLGVFRLGHIVNFISHTVILGFSTGAAILIMGTQLKGFLGIDFARQDNIALTLYETYKHIGSSSASVIFIALVTLVAALGCKRFFKKLPYLLIAMICGGLTAALVKVLFGVDDLTMIGALPTGLPEVTMPNLTWFQIRELFASAIALATLGLIQSVSISKTIAIKTGQSINANQEFIGQGLGNIACSFASGFFSSSSFTRTGVNYSAGAKTPMSSIMASGMILLVLLFAAGVTAYLPTATMSAIIILIGYQLIDVAHIKKILKTSGTETAVFLTTVMATLFLSLEFAIYSGMFLSLVMYLQKTSSPKVLPMTVDKYDPYHRLIPLRVNRKSEHPLLKIVRVDGSIFFGSVEHIRKAIDPKRLAYGTQIVLICEGVNVVDVAGAELLVFIRKILQKRGGDLFLVSLTPDVRRYLVKSPYWKQLGGRKNIFDYQAETIEAVLKIIEDNQKAVEKESKKTEMAIET